MSIHPGYMGVANVAGTIIRFSDASITAKQDVMIPDMVMGDWDRDAYTFGKVEIGGGLSGPVTERFVSNAAGGMWEWAYNRGNCGSLTSNDVLLTYFCDSPSESNVSARLFPQLMVNTLGFSCAAGDVAQFTSELIGASAPTWYTPTTSTYVRNNVTEKLITWDDVDVEITSGTGITIATKALLSNFDFSIANNITAVYAMNRGTVGGLQGGGFYPAALVPGVRTITGSISCYDPQLFDGVEGWNTPTWDADTARATLTFNIGTVPITFRVQFHRIEPKLGVGPIISTVAFTGTGSQTQSY